MNVDVDIYSKVCDHAWFVEHHESIGTTQPFVTILRGSQNYGLDTPESDVDTETILIPTLKDVLTTKDSISKTLIYPDESHCGIRDIREMIGIWKKQNPTFLELLFSPYVRIHTLDCRYKKLWDELVAWREKIARYNEYRFVHSIMGNIQTKYKAFDTLTDAHAAALEKYGYVPKELHHMMRLHYLLMDYINEVPFSRCLTQDNESIHDFLMLLKNGKIPLEKATKLKEDIYIHSMELVASYSDTHIERKNPAVEEFLNDFVVRVFKIANERELK